LSVLALDGFLERPSITYASRESVSIFYNNINTKSVKYVEEIAKATALLHNITTQNKVLKEIILT